MIEIQQLEIHVSEACNLFCEQCSHFSNFSHSGVLSPERALSEMSKWSGKLRPTTFALLGGEPTINPNLSHIIEIAREQWPESNLLLVTNGFLLHRHPHLPKILESTRCKLAISIHHDSDEYRQKLLPTINLINSWVMNFNICVQYRSSSTRWRQLYHMDGGKMLPYEDDAQRESWCDCKSKWCMQIREGHLWKCPQLAYLRPQLKKVNMLDHPKWQPYLAYQPLPSTCTDDELNEFVHREDESFCKMCPKKALQFELTSPLRP